MPPPPPSGVRKIISNYRAKISRPSLQAEFNTCTDKIAFTE
jgi:hypothetical protein